MDNLRSLQVFHSHLVEAANVLGRDAVIAELVTSAIENNSLSGSNCLS
jgi:hypothetical protein